MIVADFGGPDPAEDGVVIVAASHDDEADGDGKLLDRLRPAGDAGVEQRLTVVRPDGVERADRRP